MMTDIFDFFFHFSCIIRFVFKKKGGKGLIYYSVDAIIIIDKFRQIQDVTIIKI